jgi:hypothetical protein
METADMTYRVAPHPSQTPTSLFKFAVMLGETVIEGFAIREDAENEADTLNREMNAQNRERIADAEAEEDGEPMGSHDLSDDADALASAGWGTDEDYGGCHGDDGW